MDFDQQLMRKKGHGSYEPLDTKLLPPLYIAYREELSEVSDRFHNNIRDRFDRGDRKVVAAMRQWAQLTDKVKETLLTGHGPDIAPLLNANFDKRCSIYRLSEDNLAMVETARAQGASAKFTGSGGAIVGTFRDHKMFLRLKQKLGQLGVQVIKPKIVSSPSTFV